MRFSMGSRALGLVVTVTLLVLSARPGTAQTWDPLEYLSLIEQSDQAYARSEALPIHYQQARQELLLETLRLRQDALERLRRALLARDIPEDDPLYGDAVIDLFNLNENLIFLLMELRQCDAAQVNLERSLSTPDLLPEGGADVLENLRPLLRECRVQLERNQHLWDFERMTALLEQAENAQQQAERWDAVDNERAYAGALFESVQANSAALDILRGAMISGAVDAENPMASGQLFDLYHQLVTDFFEMDQCDAAGIRLNRAIQDANRFGGDVLAFERRRTELTACQQRLAAAEARANQVVVGEDVRPLPRYASVGPAPYILWGISGASAITAVVLDITASSDRDELELLQSCSGASCDFDRATELSESLGDRKVTIGILAGASVVTGIVGLIMFFTADTSPNGGEVDLLADPPEARIEPVFGFDEVGVRVTF